MGNQNIFHHMAGTMNMDKSQQGKQPNHFMFRAVELPCLTHLTCT